MSIKSFAILASTAIVAISSSASAEQRHSSAYNYEGYRNNTSQLRANNVAPNYNNYQSASGQTTSSKKYEPQVEVGGKFGNTRNVGAAKMMVPLYQTNDSMLFTDIRGRLDDNSSEEYNIGVGYRAVTKMGDADLVVGGYGFYDQLSSELGNDYSQVTLGLEAMTEKWDVRANGYLPEDSENATGAGVLEISGGSIGVRGGLESALPGFDAEIGYKLPIKEADVRVYAGGYHFSKSGYDTISGPSGRVEVTVDERQLNFLPSGSEVTLGLEAQYDDVREEQYYALAEFRIPFAYDGAQSQRKNLSAIDRRMMKFVERDVDIVTSAGGRANTLEDAVIDGARVNNIVTIDASDNINTEVANAGQNSLIVVNGAAGQVNSASVINMQDNQAIIGGGATITAIGADSGIVTSRTLTGSRATISGGGGAATGINTANNSVIKNIDYTNVQTIVQINDDSNVVIDNLSNSGGTPTTGIAFSGTNGTVALSNLNLNNSVNAIRGQSGTTTNLSLNNSSLTTSTGTAADAFINSGGTTITNLSGTGNTLAGTPDCTNTGTVTNGSFTYNGSTTCP